MTPITMVLPLQVMISSRMKEFAAERKAIKGVLDQLRFAAVLFENEPATGAAPEVASLQLAEQCDIFVILLGNDLSPIVKKEYERANARLKDEILIFVKSGPHSKEMTEFIRTLETRHKRVGFVGVDDLSKGVEMALINLTARAVRQAHDRMSREGLEHQPKIEVKVKVGLFLMDRTPSDVLFMIDATNQGTVTVRISSPMEIEFPDGKRWILPTAKSNHPMPHDLSPRDSCVYWLPLSAFAQKLQSEGFAGRVALVGVFRDVTRREFRSGPFPFNVERGLRGEQDVGESE